jgi:SAM-dependent methyltransferase
MKIERRYLDGTYLSHNPSWDCGDSLWKANLVVDLLSDCKAPINSIVEVGCGSGYVLSHLRHLFPDTSLDGYDISPQAASFWSLHEAVGGPRIKFTLADFHAVNTRVFDVLLMLDVFEHVRDPMTFLEQSRNHARFFVFHIPLDLSAQSVLRSAPLLRARRKVGHLHSYTKDLALELLFDCGYNVLKWRYSGACKSSASLGIVAKLLNLLRKSLSFVSADFSARLLGGETLIVLATTSVSGSMNQ